MDMLSTEIVDGIATLTFKREAALNALCNAVLDAMEDSLNTLEADPEVRAILITGKGKAFIAGADIHEMASFDSRAAELFAKRGSALFDRMELYPKPIIAAVNGFAYGGGMELAMAADFVIASETASFALPELKLGLIPGFGGCRRILRAMSLADSKRFLFTAQTLDAKEAFSKGLVQEVVTASQLLEVARKRASEVIAMSPHAVALGKKLLHACADSKDTDSQAIFRTAFEHPDAREGIAAFLEKRKPEWFQPAADS
jgi:enoyl-CoA hydratase